MKAKQMINDDDFLFDEKAMVKLLGRKEVKRLKAEEPETYIMLRNNPILNMGSDVIPQGKDDIDYKAFLDSIEYIGSDKDPDFSYDKDDDENPLYEGKGESE